MAAEGEAVAPVTTGPPGGIPGIPTVVTWRRPLEQDPDAWSSGCDHRTYILAGKRGARGLLARTPVTHVERSYSVSSTSGALA
jgi:hypothetical protein